MSEPTPDEALLAFGALVGALTYAPPEAGVVMTMTLGRGAKDPPRLSMRFQGRLPDVYEVTLTKATPDNPREEGMTTTDDNTSADEKGPYPWPCTDPECVIEGISSHTVNFARCRHFIVPPLPGDQRGFYRKYNVERIDGDPEGLHGDCEYFTVDLTHDPFAAATMLAYADACAATHPALAVDLRARFATTEEATDGPN